MVLDWELNPGAPALAASTIPLGYQGGGSVDNHPNKGQNSFGNNKIVGKIFSVGFN